MILLAFTILLTSLIDVDTRALERRFHMKVVLKKERNPFVRHLVCRKQGAHVKSHKANRAFEKVKIKKEVQCEREV
jgi:hypothetical protein